MRYLLHFECCSYSWLTPIGSRKQIDCCTLAGEPVDRFIDRAAGNNALIGDVKVSTANGWFAARPSGTEDIYKIYAESFRNADHLAAILA